MAKREKYSGLRYKKLEERQKHLYWQWINGKIMFLDTYCARKSNEQNKRWQNKNLFFVGLSETSGWPWFVVNISAVLTRPRTNVKFPQQVGTLFVYTYVRVMYVGNTKQSYGTAIRPSRRAVMQ